MPVYRLTSDNEDVATIESPDLAQAKKDGAFLLRAYGRRSGEIASRNGRTVRILGSDVLSVSTEDAGLDERFRDFVDEYRLKPGQNIGDYVIHGDADYDYYGGPCMAVWCEAENVMGTFDAGYLDFKVPIEYLFSSGMTWAQLKSVMTYAYDATVTDDLANVYATLPGSDPDAKRIVMGSHIDSVKNPLSGWIRADGIGGIVIDGTVDCRCEVRTDAKGTSPACPTATVSRRPGTALGTAPSDSQTLAGSISNPLIPTAVLS